MSSNRNEFVRLIGCLRIHIGHLQQGLRKNDLQSMETESQQIQELLLDLLRKQRTLPKKDQQAFETAFRFAPSGSIEMPGNLPKNPR